MKYFRYLNKILVVLLLVSPLVLDTACKKQIKCGCGNDVVRTLDKEPARIIFDVENSSAYFSLVGLTSDTYYLCNPSQFIDYLSDFTSGVVLLVSGKAYYECNYLYNSSNYPYMPFRVFQIDVTALEEDLYGK